MSDDFRKAYLEDLGALNGCYINGLKVQENTKKRLHHMDVLRFGTAMDKCHQFRFISTRQEKLNQQASDSDDGEGVDRRRFFDFPRAVALGDGPGRRRESPSSLWPLGAGPRQGSPPSHSRSRKAEAIAWPSRAAEAPPLVRAST